MRIKNQICRKLIIVFTFTSLIILFTITALLIKSFDTSGTGMEDKSKIISKSQSINSVHFDASLSEDTFNNHLSDSLISANYSNYSQGQNQSSIDGSSTMSQSRGKSSSGQSSSQRTDYIPLGIESTKGEKIMNDTVEYFSGRTSFLSKSLSESTFYFLERLLDEKTQTRAFIIAKDENYALNLNGYFYYLLDRTSSSDIVSPFVLNVSVLFDESSRDEVCRSGEYAQRKHLNALRNSLTAALGKYYTEEVYEFIYEGYKETFAGRISGQPSKASLYKLKVNELEIVFHNSFLTYIEFYIVKK